MKNNDYKKEQLQTSFYLNRLTGCNDFNYNIFDQK